MFIKVMADYFCSPLWWDEHSGDIGPIELDELPLSENLRDALERWADEFTATFHDENPVRFEWPAPGAEAAWRELGLVLAQQVQQELGPTAHVRYWHDARLGEPRALAYESSDRPAPKSAD